MFFLLLFLNDAVELMISKTSISSILWLYTYVSTYVFPIHKIT